MPDWPTTIARYQVLQLLASGAMSSVFLARDPAIDRLVVVKLLNEEFSDAQLRQRFMREARLAGRLSHINIVTIFDVGEHGNQPFIAMEYVDGETLHALITRKAAVSIRRKIQLIDSLAAGLQYAHGAGILHLDIKPKNIMLDADGVLKILDFGLPRVIETGESGLRIGALNYMAPEQMKGVPDLDSRADQFSTGAVFYELLVNRQAFPGDLMTGVIHRVIHGTPAPLLSIDPSLDKRLVAIVEKCLEKSRDDRFTDMAALRREVAAIQLEI